MKFRVTWEVEVEVESPLEAVPQAALALLSGSGSLTNVAALDDCRSRTDNDPVSFWT